MKKTCYICGILFILYFVHGVYGNCNPTSGGVNRYGLHCKYRCHCMNNEQCDLNTGYCSSGCAFEWTGPGCQYKNIALGRQSRHSDNLQYSDNRYADLANDRDLTTCSYTAEANYTGITKAPWYALWFKEEITFNQFVITTDDAHLGYFPNFRVSVQSGITENEHKARYYKNGTECYHHTSSIPQQKTIRVQCTKPLVGNQLRIQLANTSTQLVLCDFRVYSVCKEQFYEDGDTCQTCGFCSNQEVCNSNTGTCKDGCAPGYKNTMKCHEECDNGSYGQDCKQKCPNCKNNDCDKVNGVCRNGCIPGYQGDKCNSICTDGYYGDRCSTSCINCLRDSSQQTCNNVDGECLHGCMTGWKGYLCTTECESGKWGNNCKNDCGHCTNSPCDRFDGTCKTGCKPGYKNTRCDKECDAGTFGISCRENCSSNCVQAGICNNIDGKCNGCQPGWIGTFCNKNCDFGSFGENCSFRCPTCKNYDCSDETGVCIDGCKPGYEGDNCDKECAQGYYGESCKAQCTNCMYTRCSNIDGKCLQDCKPGWKGDMCMTECEPGEWGYNCLYQCGNCANSPCDKFDGTCTSGCKPGYKNTSKCDEECDTGTYGISCQGICSLNCILPGICNNIDGNCNWCQAGWKGNLCDEECNDGTFGPNCLSNCGGCKMGQCNKIDGSCDDGCIPGYKTTNLCNKECGEGTYGINCSKKCSKNCVEANMCDKTDGNCNGCLAGWTGMHCDSKCEPGRYGDKCLEECGSCAGNETCRHTNGVCIAGCNPGFKQTDLCKTKEVVPLPIAGIAGGSSAAVVVIIIVIIVFIILHRRRQLRKKEPYVNVQKTGPEHEYDVVINTENDNKTTAKQENTNHNKAGLENGEECKVQSDDTYERISV